MKTGVFFISIIVVVFMTWLGDRAQPEPAVADLPVAAAPAQGIDFAGEPLNTTLSSEAVLYLETTFCNDGLCGDAGWQRWIIADVDSVWTVEDLAMVRDILQNTLGALEALGLDGQTLLDGYRFRRFAGEYVDHKPGRVALIVHSKMEITISDRALAQQSGFYIFHEIGHAVDRRLGRQFSDRFHRLATNDYKLRRQAQQDREEATADAFAVWVMVDYMGKSKPVFHNTPATADYGGISQAVAVSLTSARTIRPE